LRRGAVTVDETVLVRDVVALFLDRRVGVVIVTDMDGRASGVVHESQLVRQIQDLAYARKAQMRLGWDSISLESASDIMRPAAVVTEHVPLREAVMSMANGHQRQLLVIDAKRRPIGVLVDVDALHALHTRGSGSTDQGE
jgi:predicted transcriptional regulator